MDGAFLQSRVDRASEVARAADREVARMTGKGLDSWIGDARRMVRDHPLGALAVTLGIGYVLGKLAFRG